MAPCPPPSQKRMKLKISIYSNSELTSFLYSSHSISPEAPLYVVLEAQDSEELQHVILVNSFSIGNSNSAADADFIRFIKDECLPNNTVSGMSISDNQSLLNVQAFHVSGSDMTGSVCAPDNE
ncbi:hypothetical protein FKM82_014044 [Ascaphus truei]